MYISFRFDEYLSFASYQRLLKIIHVLAMLCDKYQKSKGRVKALAQNNLRLNLLQLFSMIREVDFNDLVRFKQGKVRIKVNRKNLL